MNPTSEPDPAPQAQVPRNIVYFSVPSVVQQGVRGVSIPHVCRPIPQAARRDLMGAARAHFERGIGNVVAGLGGSAAGAAIVDVDADRGLTVALRRSVAHEGDTPSPVITRTPLLPLPCDQAPSLVPPPL